MLSFILESPNSSDDSKFMENLYKKNKSWMHLRAFKYIKNLEVSEDIVQETFVKLIPHIEKLKSFSDVERRSYIAVSIDNTAKTYLKSQSRTVTAFDADAANLEYVADDYSVERELERKFEYDVVKSCYLQLEERDKDLIMMKYGLDATDQQISDSIHIKKDSVRMTVRRSVIKLKEKVLKKVNE